MEALGNPDVWKRACRLSVDLYKGLNACQGDGFGDHITRSAFRANKLKDVSRSWLLETRY